MIKRLVTFCLGALILGMAFLTPPSFAANPTNGAQVFQSACAGCHVNGGNIVRRNKTLKLKALQQNGYATEAAIVQLVVNGKNNMPAYKDRLSKTQIQDVSAYVLEQAKKGWK